MNDYKDRFKGIGTIPGEYDIPIDETVKLVVSPSTHQVSGKRESRSASQARNFE